jgi:uncharacterized membrane protein YwaF
MKITGLILTVLGLIGGAICVFLIAQPTGANPEAVNTADKESALPGMLIPLAICGAAVAVGVLMLMFGGRGYVISYNPKVRN